MAVGTNDTLDIATIEKSELPDPELSEDNPEEEELLGEIDDLCEPDYRYIPGAFVCTYDRMYPKGPCGLAYPICIGDRINHSGVGYEIIHRLGMGAFSIVWLARDLMRNESVALKVMVEGIDGEKEFSNQNMLKAAGNLEGSGLNLYQDTFLLESPYNETRKEGTPAMFHRVLVLPLAGPSLGSCRMRFERSLRSRMAAAKSLLEALRDLHKAGFVHGDLSLTNVLWKVEPSFLQEITNSPDQAFGGSPIRRRLLDCEGLKAGDVVLPAEFPLHRLESHVVLSDFGLLLRDKSPVEDRLKGATPYIAPERHHGCDPSPASDMWSFMIMFVYLYLGRHAFPGSDGELTSNPTWQLCNIRDHLGPFPVEWATPEATKYKEQLYASPTEVDVADPPASDFATRLSENWQKDVADMVRSHSARAARSDAGPRDVEALKRLDKEYEAKKEAEPHALEVIHSIFRYMPERRLTAEQLLVDPHWVKLMQICGVQDGSEGVQ